MAQPLTVALPPRLVIGENYSIAITAIDPNSGATVPGVTISDATLQVSDTGGVGLPLQPIILIRER